MSKRLEAGDVIYYKSYYHGYCAISIISVTAKIAYTNHSDLKLRRDISDKGHYVAYNSSNYKYTEFKLITDDVVAAIKQQELEAKAKMFFGNGMAKNLPLRLKVEIYQKYSPLRINIGFIDIASMSGSHEYSIDYLGCSVAVVDFDTDVPTVTLQRDGKDIYISTNATPSRIYRDDAYVCVQCDEWQLIGCGGENIPPFPFGQVKHN